MKNFQNLFGNQFQTGIVASDLHLKNFVEDMLVRYAHYNTSGQYDTVINLTETLYNGFFGQINNQAVLLALRKSRTRSVNIVLADFEKEVTHIGNVIGAKFGKNTTQYPEFFPNGLTYLHDVTIETFPTAINLLDIAVATHAGDFDPLFVAGIHTFKTKFEAARGEQLIKKEDVTAGVLTKADARTLLEIQLTINLLDLAKEFILTPEKGWAFFNQNLLSPTHKHPQGGDETGEYTLDIPVGIKAMAEFELKNEPNYYLLITNTGTVNVKGYTCANTTGLPVPDSAFTLLPGESKVFSYAELGSLPHLFFFTDSSTTAAQVTIDQVDAPEV